MTKPSCLSLAIPKAPTTADFAYPWLSSSAHLTPPYSPGKLPCASSPVRRCSEESTENVPAAVGGLLAIAPSANNNNNNNKTTKFPPAPACCQLHEASIDRPLDSEGSIIHEGCIGSHTVHRGEIIPDWAVGMTGRELEIRLQIAEIQKLYRDHQKELYQLSRTRRPSGKAAKKTSVDQGNAKPIRARGHSGSNRRHTAPESDGTGPLVVVEKSLSVPEITVIEAIEEEKENEKEKEEVKEKEEEKEKEKEKEKKQDEPHKDAKVEIEVESKPETTETVVANNPPESTANIVASVEMTYPFVETEIQPATTEKESFDSDKTPPVATLGLEEEQAEEEIVDSKPNAFERTAVEAAQPTPPRPTFPTTLTPEALVAGTRVIILEGGLFYSGTLSVADMDALIFQVQMDGQRSTRPYILCQEDLLLNALRELPLNENSSVHEGLRVCAVWSGQLQALYPGTVTGF
uniref:Uncharacterized protein n=1 Tax=Plectus sambesii TaxID=2011161 RepID=A0A914XM75_9BILA